MQKVRETEDLLANLPNIGEGGTTRTGYLYGCNRVAPHPHIFIPPLSQFSILAIKHLCRSSLQVKLDELNKGGKAMGNMHFPHLYPHLYYPTCR